MIAFEKVSFSYSKGTPILKDVSFQIEKGVKIGLIGANGAGKSTLMKIVLGLLMPEGRVFIDEMELNKKNLVDIRKKVGFVLQDSDHQMFMPTVKEDMIFGPMNYGMTREQAEKKAESVLKELKLEYLMDRYNHRISGGEKRMAAIATILAMEPQILLLDEPTSSLDPKNRRTVINLLKELTQTMIISSHDLDFIWETCDRVILINQGRIIAEGETKAILKDKKLLEENDLELPLGLQ